MESRYDPIDCPLCLKKGCVIRIQYGEPNDKIFNLSLIGKVKLGGCNVDDKNYYCKNCKISMRI